MTTRKVHQIFISTWRVNHNIGIPFSYNLVQQSQLKHANYVVHTLSYCQNAISIKVYLNVHFWYLTFKPNQMCKVKILACSLFYASFSLNWYATWPPSKGENIFFLKVVMLHIKLKRMKHTKLKFHLIRFTYIVQLSAFWLKILTADCHNSLQNLNIWPNASGGWGNFFMLLYFCTIIAYSN